MRTRLWKEVRLLAPAWIAALFVATVPLWLRYKGEALTSLWLLCLLAGLAALAVDSFGREFSLRTFSGLMQQPIGRTRLWLEKASVLAIAVISVLAVFWALVQGTTVRSVRMELGIVPITFLGLAAWSGGLCMALFTRKMIGAFWLTLILPPVLSFTAIEIAPRWFPSYGESFWLVAAFIAYVACTALSSWVLVGRYQDVQRTADRALYPVHLRQWFAKQKAKGRISALVWKELHLQQINVILAIAAPFVVVMLLVATGTPTIPNATLLYIQGLAALLFGLIPLLVGGISISQERELGLLNWHLTQPTKFRTQFVIKLAVVYGLSLTLGALLPWLLDGMLWKVTGRSLIGGAGFQPTVLAHACGYAIGVATIALFASSLSRDTLRSLALGGVLVAAAAVALVALRDIDLHRQYAMSPAKLWERINVPTLFALLLLLAYRSARKPVITIRDRVCYGLAVAGAVIFVSAAAIAVYSRAWELVLPEPIQPTGKPIAGTVTPRIVPGMRWQILLHDGSLRTGALRRPPHVPPISEFEIEPSRWIGCAAGGNLRAAIKSDGTLWIWKLPRWEPPNFIVPEPVQIGADSNWKTVTVGYDGYVLAIRENGTLWESGRRHRRFGDEISLTQIGEESDWLSASAGFEHAIALKKDGSLWQWGQVFQVGIGGGVIHAYVDSPERVDESTNWIAATSVNDFGCSLAIQRDGSLWGWGRAATFPLNPRVSAQDGSLLSQAMWNGRVAFDSSSPLLLWNGHKMRGVTAAFGDLAWIADDGTLWTWTRRRWQLWNGPERLSRRTDWAAVAMDHEGIVALTAEGDLCGWKRFMDYSREQTNRPLLRDTRRPTLIARLGPQ